MGKEKGQIYHGLREKGGKIAMRGWRIDSQNQMKKKTKNKRLWEGVEDSQKQQIKCWKGWLERQRKRLCKNSARNEGQR